jgi:hypothetical protein
MSSSTDWFYDGCPVGIEFREIGPEGATALQSRNIYTFHRHLLTVLTADVVLTEGSLGTDDSGANIYGYVGAQKISAVVIGAGNNKFICVSDEFMPCEPGAAFVERYQRWEKRDDWADYTWAT